MNTKSEFERIVSDWLEDRVADPPHGSLRSALERADQTPQQRHRWLPRWLGRRSGATRSAERGDTSADTDDRRNRLMFSATAVAASVAALALVATLVLPQGASERDPAPGAGGPTHRVAADGSRDYQTINDALAAAEDGDTILVAPGTYTEYLLIDKDITVAGDGPREEIVVEFPEGGPVQVFEDDDEGPYSVSFPVVLQGSDAILRGFTIRVPPEGVGVQVDGGGPELVDLSVVAHPDAQASGDISDIEVMALTFVNGSSPVLRDSSWTGTLYSGGSSPTIEGNTVTAGHMALDGPGEAVVRANTFLDGASFHLDFELTGIIVDNDLSNGSIGIGAGSSMTVQDNVFRGTRSGYGDVAIGVSEPGSSAHIVGNTVTDGNVGISVSDGAVATVEDNDLTDNDVAIQWSSTETGAIRGNAVRGGGIGIEIVAGDPSVVDNVVEGAGSWGMVIDVATRPTLEGNTVCGSGKTNLYVVEGADPVVGENEICPDEVEPTE